MSDPEIVWSNGTAGTVKGWKFINQYKKMMVQLIEAPTISDTLLDLVNSNITNVSINQFRTA